MKLFDRSEIQLPNLKRNFVNQSNDDLAQVEPWRKAGRGHLGCSEAEIFRFLEGSWRWLATGAGFHPSGVMLFYPNPTSQPKTFPWALVPSGGSKAERRPAKSLGFGHTREAHKQDLNLSPNFRVQDSASAVARKKLLVVFEPGRKVSF